MIRLTPAARAKIDALVAAEAVREPALRIVLDGEAPSPLQRAYRIHLVEREDRHRTEIAVNVDGVRVFLNLDTSHLLGGAVVDWDENEGAFRVYEANPRAAMAAARGAPARPSAPDLPPGSLAERVQRLFDEVINPRIALHGGAVELVDADEDGTIYVRMTGGCQGCAASAVTLRLGIERMVREALPEVGEIVDVTDHAAGTNPYYR